MECFWLASIALHENREVSNTEYRGVGPLIGHLQISHGAVMKESATRVNQLEFGAIIASHTLPAPSMPRYINTISWTPFVINFVSCDKYSMYLFYTRQKILKHNNFKAKTYYSFWKGDSSQKAKLFFSESNFPKKNENFVVQSVVSCDCHHS